MYVCDGQFPSFTQGCVSDAQECVEVCLVVGEEFCVGLDTREVPVQYHPPVAQRGPCYHCAHLSPFPLAEDDRALSVCWLGFW